MLKDIPLFETMDSPNWDPMSRKKKLKFCAVRGGALSPRKKFLTVQTTARALAGQRKGDNGDGRDHTQTRTDQLRISLALYFNLASY